MSILFGLVIKKKFFLLDEFVTIFEKSTLCHNLIQHTFSPLLDYFPCKDFIQPNKKWCPYCFSEMDGNLYEPLIWAFYEYNICHRHHIVLETQCSDCKKNQKTNSPIPIIGHCQFCGEYLGKISEFTKCSTEYEIWSMNQISLLILNFRVLIKRKNMIPANIRIIFSDRPSLTIKEFGLYQCYYYDYLHRGKKPTISSVLRICKRLDTNIVDFISSDLYLKKY